MMQALCLKKLAPALDAMLLGEDVRIEGVEIDSRQVNRGQLFVALRGDNFDGHEFVSNADKAGASACVLDSADGFFGNGLLVNDTRLALAQLSGINRDVFPGPVIGLTGSVGKTTCKEMLASILRISHNVHATVGNKNNEIGVPLTLLALEPEHDVAVIEMGAAQQGDIAFLNRWVKPNIVLVTNVVASHIGRFGDIETIAKTKAELYTQNSTDVTAVVNLDNAYTRAMLESLPQHDILTFSCIDDTASIFAKDIEQLDSGVWRFCLCSSNGTASVTLPVLGKHNISNALAAAATAMAADASFDDVVSGLEAFEPAAGRLNKHQLSDEVLIIDDSYNANPESMKAAVDVLSTCAGLKVLVCGDMGELGEDSVALHQEVGRYASSRIDKIMSIGLSGQDIGGSFNGDVEHFDNKTSLIKACQGMLDGQTTMLIKGSRSVGLDVVVDALLAVEVN